MARASGVWLVRFAYPDPDLIVGAFTVKHECAKWLKAQPDATRYLVDRLQDGKPNVSPVRVPIHELLQMHTYAVRYGVLCTQHTDSGIGSAISVRPYPTRLSN